MLKSCLGKLPRKPSHHAVFSRHGFLRCGRLAIPRVKYHQQKGFTLLEMLVVIGLIGIVAMGSATLLIDDGDWKRQDETVKRWDAIRKAIIGEPNLSLNGSPYVAGYVADMGRLPRNISELFLRGTQPDWTEVNLYTAGAGFSSALSGGWRIPYLYTAGSAQYRDGWSNENAANPANDSVNFGWNVGVDGTFPNLTDITVQSLGNDNLPNGNEYNQDFPLDPNQAIVSLNEWTLSAADITFNINFNKKVSATSTPPTLPPVGSDGLPQELELRIYRYIDNGDASANFVGDIQEEIASSTFTLAQDNTFAPAQTITPSINLPIGRFAAVIWCVDNVPSGTDAVYDGNCDATFNHSPVHLTLNHSTTQVTITWNLP